MLTLRVRVLQDKSVRICKGSNIQVVKLRAFNMDIAGSRDNLEALILSCLHFDSFKIDNICKHHGSLSGYFEVNTKKLVLLVAPHL